MPKVRFRTGRSVFFCRISKTLRRPSPTPHPSSARGAMLFWLDNSVADALDAEKIASHNSHAVDLLCLAVAEGKHRVTGERQCLKRLLRNSNLQVRSRAVL